MYEKYANSVVLVAFITCLGGILGGILALMAMFPPMWVIYGWLMSALYTTIGIFVIGRDRDY